MSEPAFQIDGVTSYIGDVREVLAGLPAESVHCVVTSPPYFGLRDYGTATWEGGDPACDHRHQLGGEGEASAKQNTSRGTQSIAYRDVCRKCGARRIDRQIGLEQTPEEYVASIVAVFREVRRVLRKDGTVWLNLGDSYVGGGRGGNPDDSPFRKQATNRGSLVAPTPVPKGLKPKDLVGIPWMVAFALRSDGWWLRRDVIWEKPNAMPESAEDRPTSSHEYVFLLTKSKHYYYDHVAVKEQAVSGSWPGIGPKRGTTDKHKSDYRPMAVNSGRNLRSVWTIPTQPFPGAHFATFPTKLVEPCVKAGTSERGVCPKCGAPWRRVVKRGEKPPEPEHRNPEKRLESGQAGNVGEGNMGFRASKLSGQEMARWKASHPDQTDVWHPTCRHDAEPVPATVLDPFGGTGTTALVARKLGRQAILIDLNREYLDLQKQRLGMTEWEAAA